MVRGMRPYSTLASTALVFIFVLGSIAGGACKKDEAQPAATPPPPAPEMEKKPEPPPPPPAPEKPKFTEVPGFQAPESVLYVADGDYYLVSNVNGEPNKVDDNEFVLLEVGEFLKAK